MTLGTWDVFPSRVGLACQVSAVVSHCFCVLHKNRPDVDTGLREAQTDGKMAVHPWHFLSSLSVYHQEPQ